MKAERRLKKNILPKTMISKMNNNSTEYWNVKKEKLKQKYPNISEKDLQYREGREQEMMDILSFKLGKTKQELLSIIVTI